MDDSSPLIREATFDDADMLAQIIREAFRDVAERFRLTPPENAPTHPSRCTPDWIRDDFDKGVRYFALEAGGIVCGCVGLRRDGEETFKIRRLTVLSDCRGKGFGSLLLRHAEDVARCEGAAHVTLGIIAAHLELRKWYEKRGYVIIETKEFPHLSFDVATLKKVMRRGAMKRWFRKSQKGAALHKKL
jgi:N-acetylglutamate synthase-like GNAT family acetyltransferase